MSDHLLRLARIVERIARDPKGLSALATARLASALISDLEAAPQPERPSSPVEAALREFAGFISGDIPELHGVEVPRIAESVNRYLNASGPHVPPAPERRTITREEWEWLKRCWVGIQPAQTMLEKLRLTVEDA